MSDTPKTDAFAERGRTIVSEDQGVEQWADFARQLERELAEAKAAAGIYEGGMTAARAVMDADRSAPSSTAEQEPVAWQWRLKGQGQWGPWKAIKCEDYGAQYFRTAQLQRGRVDAEAYEVRPLYAAPVSATQRTDQRIIKARQLMYEWELGDSADHYNILRDLDEILKASADEGNAK
jgi:hypothetical protein